MTGEHVVAEARTWLGTPFLHQHRMKGVGVDCVGLVIGVAKNLGLLAVDFDLTGYSRTPDGRSLLETCDQHMDRIAIRDAKPGNVLVIRWEKDPQHLGIVGDYRQKAGEVTLIHALGTSDGKGRVIEHRLSRERFADVVCAYSLRGIE